MPSISSTLSILESTSCCPMNDPHHHRQQSNGGTSRVSHHLHPCSSTRASSEDFTMMNPPEANDMRHDHSSYLFQQPPLASALPFEDEDEEELRLVQPVTPDDHFNVSFRSLFEMTHESWGCADEEQEQEPLLSRESHQVFSQRIMMMTSNKTNHESMAASSSTTAGLKRTAHGGDDDCSFSSKEESATRRKRPRRTTTSAPSSSPSSVVSSVLVSSSCCDYSVSSSTTVSHHDGWSAKIQELQQFKLKHGHSSVPCTSTSSSNDDVGTTASLARWVKRQRHQYKRKRNGQPSTMTDERMAQLENECDFVWDSHQDAFQRRWNELAEFKATYGHTSPAVVTSTTSTTTKRKRTKYYYNNHHHPQQQPSTVGLATWCKCQRQQYRLYVQGKPSNLSRERIHELERLEFDWKPHHPQPQQEQGGAGGRPRRASPS
jgi:Helicase associated domain